MKPLITFIAVATGGFAVLGTFAFDSWATEPLRSEPIRLVAQDSAARQPQAAVDAQGRIHIVFGRGNEVCCATSTDSGKTYKTATVGKVAVHVARSRSSGTAASRTVIVTAIGGKEGKGRDGDVLAWRSDDAGGTWAGPTRINSVMGQAREGLHGMAAGPDGAVYCAWLDLRTNRMEIRGARSKDGGLTWEVDGLIY